MKGLLLALGVLAVCLFYFYGPYARVDTARKRAAAAKRALLESEYKGVDLPILQASMMGDEEDIKIMLAADEDVNVQNKEGYTSLLLAAYYNHPNIIRILLESGANRYAKNMLGKTALQIATEKGHDECLAILKLESSTWKPDAPAFTAFVVIGTSFVFYFVATAKRGKKDVGPEKNSTNTKEGGAQTENTPEVKHHDDIQKEHAEHTATVKVEFNPVLHFMTVEEESERLAKQKIEERKRKEREERIKAKEKVKKEEEEKRQKEANKKAAEEKKKKDELEYKMRRAQMAEQREMQRKADVVNADQHFAGLFAPFYGRTKYKSTLKKALPSQNAGTRYLLAVLPTASTVDEIVKADHIRADSVFVEYATADGKPLEYTDVEEAVQKIIDRQSLVKTVGGTGFKCHSESIKNYHVTGDANGLDVVGLWIVCPEIGVYKKEHWCSDKKIVLDLTSSTSTSTRTRYTGPKYTVEALYKNLAEYGCKHLVLMRVKKSAKPKKPVTKNSNFFVSPNFLEYAEKIEEKYKKKNNTGLFDRFGRLVNTVNNAFQTTFVAWQPTPSDVALVVVSHSQNTEKTVGLNNKTVVTFTNPGEQLSTDDALKAMKEMAKTHKVALKVGKFRAKPDEDIMKNYPLWGDDEWGVHLVGLYRVRPGQEMERLEHWYDGEHKTPDIGQGSRVVRALDDPKSGEKLKLDIETLISGNSKYESCLKKYNCDYLVVLGCKSNV